MIYQQRCRPAAPKDTKPLVTWPDKIIEYIKVPQIAPQNRRAKNNSLKLSPFVIPFQFLKICIKKYKAAIINTDITSVLKSSPASPTIPDSFITL